MSLGSKTFALKAMLTQGARISWEIPHAQDRAKLRLVPKHLAERVIRQGGPVVRVNYEGTRNERWRLFGTPDNDRTLIVVVKPTSNNVLRVITVFWKD